MLYLYVKRHEKLDFALDLYRRGIKVVTIADLCKVDRRTIHRWINEEGASRDDYRRMKEIAAIKAQKEAEKQQRKEDQIYEYTLNMCWEVLCRTLPWLEVRNWRDVERVMELIELARDNGCSRIYKHLSEQVAFFNEQELR